ncbi:MAG: hypothetical protein U9P10_04340 [Thermodesulfobacteriota bacterium]|nr:hypothetical protein [Thermodesulfobacteriota bacterium]
MSQNYIAFYVEKNNTWRFNSRTDIESVTLGVIAGWDYGKWLLDYIHIHHGNDDR